MVHAAHHHDSVFLLLCHNMQFQIFATHMLPYQAHHHDTELHALPFEQLLPNAVYALRGHVCKHQSCKLGRKQAGLCHTRRASSFDVAQPSRSPFPRQERANHNKVKHPSQPRGPAGSFIKQPILVIKYPVISPFR